jgi:hypothetical protein
MNASPNRLSNMNDTLLGTIAVIVIIVAGMWYWSNRDTVVTPTPEPIVLPTPIVTPPVTTSTYTNDELNYSVTLPTKQASTASETLYRVDTAYSYTKEPDTVIEGIQFTIHGGLIGNTNLSKDTYLSIESLEDVDTCEAEAFISSDEVTSRTITDNDKTYSFATTTEGAAGNRYEEYVYAIPDSSPCIALRYYIHTTAIENYPTGTVTAYNKTTLLNTFDQIRRSLTFAE